MRVLAGCLCSDAPLISVSGGMLARGPEAIQYCMPSISHSAGPGVVLPAVELDTNEGAAPVILYPYMFFKNMSLVKLAFPTTATLFTVHKWPTKHALRQTANLPNKSLFVPTVYLRRKVAFTPILFVLPRPVDLSKSYLLCLNPLKLLLLYFGILQRLTRIIALLRKYFTKPGAPLEA